MSEPVEISSNSGEFRTVHVVAGPTASGKSAYALKLAQAVGGVIINADSLQLYDGLPLLTAQPSIAEKQSVPHFLYAHLHPNDYCSAGNWRNLAMPVIESALQHGQAPIVTGGSGLYIKALIEGLSPIPDTPPDIRRKTLAIFKELGPDGFHQALSARDPVIAARFHPANSVRFLRAWEVFEATGKPLSEWQKIPLEKPPAHWRFKIHKIMPERETLRQRCDQRFLNMIAEGALRDVEHFQARLSSSEVNPDVPLTKALGFQALSRYLKSEITLDEAILQAQAETRQYAKRQDTWFRNQM